MLNIIKNILTKTSLILILFLGVGIGAYAQTSQLPLSSGIYEIVNISNEGGAGTGRGYLVNFTNHSSGLGLANCTWNSFRNRHPLEQNSNVTCSYWYVHRHANGTYTLVSLSTLGGNSVPRYVQVGNPSRLSTTEVFLDITDNTTVSRDGVWAVKIANHSAPNTYISGACGTNSTDAAGAVRQDGGTNDGGVKWHFTTVEENTLTAEQLAIRDQYLEQFEKLPDNVTLRFQDTNGQEISSSFNIVKYTLANGTATYFSSATNTYDFNNVLFDRARFSSTFDYSLKNISFNSISNTLTFTVSLNKWYTVKVNNVNSYLSTAYTDDAGLKLQNGQCPQPTTYNGLWRMIETGNAAANADGTNVSLYNAQYYDTKLLGVGGTNWSGNAGNAARASMFAPDAVDENYWTEFERRNRPTANQYVFRLTWSKNSYSYFNASQQHLALWNSGSAYGDANSQFTLTEVPIMGEDVTVIVNALGGEIIKYNTQTEPFIGQTDFTNVVMNGKDKFNFHNMPFMASLFSVDDLDPSKKFDVEFDEANQVLKLTVATDPHYFQFSPAPTGTDWDADTKWFTIRSNRNNQSAYNRHYLSTSADFVDNNFNLTAIPGTTPADRGGYWCFVGDNTGGFQIYNNAYGPAFVLAYISNDNKFRMVPKDNVPGNAQTTFTHGSSRVLEGMSYAYTFRIGTTGVNHMHHTNGSLQAWNNGSNGNPRDDDSGSSFLLTEADYDILNHLPELDVYFTSTGGYTYEGNREVFGKRSTSPYYILSALQDGAAEIQAADLAPNADIESVSVLPIPNSYIKELVVIKSDMFSPAPINGQWSAATKWYTMRNHRAARYVSTNNTSIDSNMQLQWSGTDTKPTESEGMWCFVEDGNNGFRIYNKAYGPDFVLGITGTSTDSHTRMYHLSEANSAYTHFHFIDNTNTYNGKEEFSIIQGANSGGVGLNNIGNSYLGVWSAQESNHRGDQGSAFYIERVDNAIAAATTDYVAYYINTLSSDPLLASVSFNAEVAYNTPSLQGSRLVVPSGYYMLFDPSVDVAALPVSAFTSSSYNFPEGFTSIEVGTKAGASPTLPAITLRGKVILPHVIHRPNGNLWRAKQNNYEGERNTIGKDTEDYTDVTLSNGSTVKLQHTGVFEITHFLQPGETRQIWMPSTSSSSSNSDAKILNYMRWFDYQTETMPDLNMVNLAADQQGNLYQNAWYYQNGIVVGSSVNSVYPKRYVEFTMPSTLTKAEADFEYTLANEATRYTDFGNNFTSGTAATGAASYLGTFTDPNNKAQGNKNLIEPTIGTRQIYHLRSAHDIAQKLFECTGDKWLEEETITFPVRGVAWPNYEDVIPLEYNFLDYWSYNASGELRSVRQSGTTIQSTVEANGTGISILTKNAGDFLAGSTGVFVEANSPSSREAGHYITFAYPSTGIIPLESGTTSRTATIYVRLNVDGKEYNIKKFTLVFQTGVEPLPYYEVMGEPSHQRSDKTLATRFGTTENPTGIYNQLNFHYDHNYLMGAPNAPLTTGRGYYAFPYNFDEVSYSYFANGMQWCDWGEYGMRNDGQAATNHPTINFKPYFLSVNYLRTLYEKKNAQQLLAEANEKMRIAQEGFGLTETERATAMAEAQFYIDEANKVIDNITPQTLSEAYLNNYYIYVDASEQPGQVGRLKINEPLCTGTRIYGTAWLSASTSYLAGSPNPASVIFRFKGVKDDGSMVTIHSYCPGQISNVGRDKNRNIVAFHDEQDHNGNTYHQGIWQQVAFSFVNPYPATEFNSFVLEIFNNCRGSNGGDIFLDDIRLFVKPPQVQVDNSAPICGEELSIVRISTDFDAMMDALQGDESSETTTYYGTYAILDKEVYDNYLSKIDNPTTADISAAFNLALMGEHDKSKCYIGDKFFPELYAFHEIKFYNEFLKHDHITYAMLVGDNILETAGYMYQYNHANEIVGRNLVFNCKILDQRIAGKKYYLVFHANVAPTDMSTISHADYYEFFSMADVCCIKSEFATMRAKMVSIEGNEGLDPYNIDYCPGTAPTISLNSYGYDTNGDLIQEHGVYYDWYFGTKEQFKKEYVWLDNADIDVENLDQYTQSELITAEDFCMEHCLMNFRYFYPNAGVNELYDGTVQIHHFEKDTETDTEYELTAKMIAKLKEWVESGKLRLHLTAVSVDLSATNGEELTHVLAIQQGAKLRYDFTDTNKENPIIYCMDPVEISFYTNLESPSASVGLNGIDYSVTPYDNIIGSHNVYHSVPLRINNAQLSQIREQDNTILQVPIRVIEPSGYYKVNDGTGLINCNDIHLEVDQLDNFVYVAETNDPQWQLRSVTSDGVEYLPYVGRLTNINANKTRTDAVNYLELTFNDTTTGMNRKFVPREGYYYLLRTSFKEELNPGVHLAPEYNVPDIKCKGNILIPLKIVPEYVKWTGRESDDWNNDRNWIRADYRELVPSDTQNPSGEYADYSTNLANSPQYNEANGYNGLPLSTNDGKADTDLNIYIPMDQPSASDLYNTFAYTPMAETSVIIPTGAVRYPAMATHKRSTDTGKKGLLQLDDDTEILTPWIEYDMVAVPHSKGYISDAYYENTIKDITFMPATGMGNAHMLTYQKAWVEYLLDAERWYTLGSPLKNTVAGDWYAPTNESKQLSPLFRPITYQEGINDRFRPAIFQRSWDRDGNNIVYLKAGGTQESYVKAEWSHVYNDAAVPYSQGGFSVKPELGYITPVTDRPADAKVLVRMPKADTFYKYYDINGQTGQAPDAQIGARTNRLQTDDLGLNGKGAINMTITNQTPNNLYFLASNPFMAPMDMTEFFAHNNHLEPKYWIVDNNLQSVSIKDPLADDWITTAGDGRYVAPLQGFFVKVKEEASAQTISLGYTADMQQAVAVSQPELRSKSFAAETTETITITAERDGQQSMAVVALRPESSNDALALEDCELFVDGNLADQPAVYTAASNQSLSVNLCPELNMVPLGIISDSDAEVTLSFNISTKSPVFLYDKDANSLQPLDQATKLTIAGNTAGRYYLTASDIIDATDTTAATKRTGVWTAAGAYCGKSIKGLAPGVYVVDGVKTVIR